MITSINTQIDEVKSQIEKEKDVYDSVKNGITRIEQNIENKKTDIHRSEKQIEELQNKKVEGGKVKELEDELAVIQKDLDVELEESNIIAIMKNILSDNGIRKYIVSQYLPLLNDYIKEYMGLMEMDCFFQLDDSFDEITNTGRTNTIDYEFASQGETVRINFCIMLAFIKIAEKRCGNRIVNLIIDEAISSLDEINASLLLEIITKYLNKTVLVISHNPDIKDYFEYVYFIKKTRFSEICEE
jgi:DNA repair exonuclease SbcCD ATPase subunit